MSFASVADFSDRLMMLARVGAMMVIFVITSVIGKVSREQELRGHLFKSVDSSGCRRCEC